VRITLVSSRFAAVPRLPVATPLIVASVFGFTFGRFLVTCSDYREAGCGRSLLDRNRGYSAVTTVGIERVC
jgi:hypothetical protein